MNGLTIGTGHYLRSGLGPREIKWSGNEHFRWVKEHFRWAKEHFRWAKAG